MKTFPVLALILSTLSILQADPSPVLVKIIVSPHIDLSYGEKVDCRVEIYNLTEKKGDFDIKVNLSSRLGMVGKADVPEKLELNGLNLQNFSFSVALSEIPGEEPSEEEISVLVYDRNTEKAFLFKEPLTAKGHFLIDEPEDFDKEPDCQNDRLYVVANDIRIDKEVNLEASGIQNLLLLPGSAIIIEKNGSFIAGSSKLFTPDTADPGKVLVVEGGKADLSKAELLGVQTIQAPLTHLANITSEENMHLLLYPNPARDLIYIEIPAHHGKENLRALEVINSIGQKVMRLTLEGKSSQTLPLKISDHPAGQYTVRLTQEETSYSAKFSKVD